MIWMDRRALKVLLSLTHNCQDIIYCDDEHDQFKIVSDEGEPKIITSARLSHQDIRPALKRLFDSGYLSQCYFDEDELYFSLTNKAVHHKAFAWCAFWDSFSKSFFCGVATGIVTSIVTTIAIPALRDLFLSIISPK